MRRLLLAAALCSAAHAQVVYPPSPREGHVDEYHGTRVPDPYRWLEDLDAPRTAQWVEAQNAVTFAYLDQIPERKPIADRLTELWNFERFGTPFKEGGRYFYTRNDGLQNQSVLFVADALDAAPRILIDPNTFSGDGTVALARYSISPDGKVIAFATSDGGTDRTNWKFRSIDTGRDLPDTLTYTKFTSMSWSKDSRGVFYSRYPRGADGRGDDTKQVKIYYHALGTGQDADRLVFELDEVSDKNPYASATEDGKFLVVGIFEGYVTNAIAYADLADPAWTVRPLLNKWDARYAFVGNIGSELFFETTKDAERSRVIAFDLAHPGEDHWREVIPQQPEALENVSLVGGRLVAHYLQDAKSVVRVHRLDGSLEREIELPGVGSASGFGGKADDPETFFAFSGFTSPTTTYRLDLTTGRSTLFKRPEVKFNPDDYTTTQVFYTSKDGTRIPMFITHKQGLKLDGTNPTLLYGYGGFNVSLRPGFSVSRLVWMEMGGVFAQPNLRGGGEYGKAWHLAGTKQNKQNVFDDFIAAAEWLIANGYTSTPKLAIEGGSNGGLLVGACLSQRPDLFGACLAAVGVLDMLRYHTASMNARNWSSDYGLSEVEEDFHALFAYSPYHNLKPGSCYPATLITTADHDDRVVPWHSFKFAAAMQHAQACDNPVLIRIETRAGHGAGKPIRKVIEEAADRIGFLVHRFGMSLPNADEPAAPDVMEVGS